MTVLDEATKALRELEPELAEPTQAGERAMLLHDRIEEVRKLLAKGPVRWIGTAKAKRLLGATVPNAVPTWIRLGLLRSRSLPDGRIQVRLDDVLWRRQENEGLSAIGGEELTEEELEEMHQARPGKDPWEREQASHTQ